MIIKYPKKIDFTEFEKDGSDITKYGLPKNIKYCKKCVISNQRPNTTVEFKHTAKSKKTTINFNDKGICDACIVTDKKNKEKHWVYPINKGKVKSKECEYIYSFVVKNRQSLIIDEYIYATLGHNLHYDEVIQHNYFGTEKVINDLKRSKEYINGLISLEQSDFQRDNVTNDIFTILI